MSTPASYDRVLIKRVHAETAALRLRTAFERLRTKAGFDPNQPRVPAGNPDGGQWTDTGGNGPGRLGGGDGTAGGERAARADSAPARVVRDKTGENSWSSYTENRRPDGTLASRTITNRDGSRIVSEPLAPRRERNTVTLKDGSRFTFENDQDIQRVFDGKGRLVSEAVWTPDGPQPLPIVMPAFAGPAIVVATEKLIQVGAVLFAWSMSSKGPGEEAVFAFNATEYQYSGTERERKIVPEWIGKRSREEVEEVCERLQSVQDMADEASQKVPRNANPIAAIRGTKIHLLVKDEVVKEGNPNFKAEISLLKAKEDAGARVVTYGLKDTVRIDVFKKRSNDLVCVYDLKTGASGLTVGRTLEIVSNVFSAYPSTQRILIVEVRPKK